MLDKPFTVASYLAIGLLIALAPIVAQYRSAPATRLARDGVGISHGMRCWAWITGCGCGLIVATVLPWWRAISSGASLREIFAYCIITTASLFALSREMNANENRRVSVRSKWVIGALAGSVAVAMSFGTGIISMPPFIFVAWQHWGAYIGPAELVLSGARILYDFPAQYGFGPTLLIAAACGSNCWISMYFIAGGTALAFALLGFFIASNVTIRNLATFCMIIGAIAASFLLWVAYPPLVSSAVVMPSGAGLRFLPVLALVAMLTWSEGESRLQPHWTKLGFCFFALGALWSPESFFMSSFVWGPYYCIRRMAGKPRKQLTQVLLKSISALLLAAIGMLVVFVAIYRLHFDVYPTLSAYLAYILFPPGPLPINPGGPIWFYLAALVLGAWLSRQLFHVGGNSRAFRRSLLLLMLSYVSLSFALGRSHDNNFLDLIPYSALIISSVVASQLTLFPRGMAAGMLASLLGLTSLFGWSVWSVTIKSRRLLEFNPYKFVASLSYENPVTAADLAVYCWPSLCTPADAGRALFQIRQSSAEPTTMLDGAFVLLPSTPPAAWSAMNDPVNYYSLPREWRQTFLQRTADRLHQGGWLIVQRSLPARWVDDFQSAYSIVEQLDFGTYRALHFEPQPADPQTIGR